MRISPDEAVRLGLIAPVDGKKISDTGRRGNPVFSKAVETLNKQKLQLLSKDTDGAVKKPTGLTRRDTGDIRTKQSIAGSVAGRKGYVELDTSPQKILFDALCVRLPGRVQWEAEGLVPGRQFRADIFIPPRVVVEMDGFRFHRSKEAYQTDRERQNLFVSLGYRPIRAYTKQVIDQQRLAALIDLIVVTVCLDDDQV